LAATPLADALFSRVKQRVLGVLFAEPERSFRGAEVIQRAASGTGAVHRELVRLSQAGLVTVSRVGNQKHYRANPDSPVYSELHGLVVKTVGLVGPLAAALAPFAARIRAAFVYGSVAKGTATARSDVDLMVIADGVSYADLYAALQSAEAALRRPVNPNVMSFGDWKGKLARANSFARKVNAQPKLFVAGSEDGLA
jgi:predicted nucleotidyltransferase